MTERPWNPDWTSWARLFATADEAGGALKTTAPRETFRRLAQDLLAARVLGASDIEMQKAYRAGVLERWDELGNCVVLQRGPKS